MIGAGDGGHEQAADMRVLGIRDGETPAAALVDDGRLVAVNTRGEGSGPGGFPREAIRQVLAAAGLEGCDVDLVAVVGAPGGALLPRAVSRGLRPAGRRARLLGHLARLRQRRRIRRHETLFGVELDLDLERAVVLDPEACRRVGEAAAAGGGVRSMAEAPTAGAVEAIGAALLAGGGASATRPVVPSGPIGPPDPTTGGES
ncbi:MAG: hypothetical protein D6798_14715 [Deltaproteobacteria bacterium]|nr:MAG: hypothetical protein D6798_14715 [Deltaproteobacteria bacterium]